MATKPTATFEWATDANFSTGVASGNPTKVNPPGFPVVREGLIPDAELIPEYLNKILNICGDWTTNWVDLGSSAGAADAHIVETDSNGDTAVQGITVGPNDHKLEASGGVDETGNYQWVQAGAVGSAATVDFTFPAVLGVNRTAMLRVEAVSRNSAAAKEAAEVHMWKVTTDGAGAVTFGALSNPRDSVSTFTAAPSLGPVTTANPSEFAIRVVENDSTAIEIILYVSLTVSNAKA